jgi:glycosyltransferase involved in cell wall biosynthesis
VTLLPYLEATQSGVALMAMPLGSVVVATRVGDLPDIIEDGVTGFLCDPEPGAIAAKLMQVLSDRDRLERVRAEAARRAKEQWNWARVAERTAQGYRDVLSQSG